MNWSSVFTIDKQPLFKESQFHAKPRNESEAFLNFCKSGFFFNMIGRIITVYHYTRNGQAYVFSILDTSFWNIPRNAFGVIFVFLSL